MYVIYIFPIWVKLILFTLWANNGNNWLIIHVLAKIFSAFLIVGYLIVSLHTDKLYFLQKNNFDLFLIHVIWTEHQMTNLVLNVWFDFFSWHKNKVWKYKYKLLKMVTFDLMHHYNTLNVPQIVKLERR